jgi:hypothetical protein
LRDYIDRVPTTASATSISDTMRLRLQARSCALCDTKESNCFNANLDCSSVCLPTASEATPELPPLDHSPKYCPAPDDTCEERTLPTMHSDANPTMYATQIPKIDPTPCSPFTMQAYRCFLGLTAIVYPSRASLSPSSLVVKLRHILPLRQEIPAPWHISANVRRRWSTG